MAVRTIDRMEPDHIMEWLNDPEVPAGDVIVYYTGSGLSRDRKFLSKGRVGRRAGRTGVYKDMTFGKACAALHDAAMDSRVCLTQLKLGPSWYAYRATMRALNPKLPRGDYSYD